MCIIICIFKTQACSLVTDVDPSELHMAMETVQAYMKVAKLANKGQFKCYTVRNLPKFASVPEFKQFLLEIYLVEQSHATNHSFTGGYVSDGHTKCESKQMNNASERLSNCKSVNSSDVSQQTTRSCRLFIYLFFLMVCGLLPTTFLNVLNILNVIQFGVYLLITM